MISLLPDVDKWFYSLKNKIQILSKKDIRAESWFKGELLCFFDQNSKVTYYDCEYNYNSKRIDLIVQINGTDHYVEFKSPCISLTKTKRNTAYYFRKKQLLADLVKLQSLKLPNKWILAIFHPTLKPSEWNLYRNRINRTYYIINNPPDYFIALWKI